MSKQFLANLMLNIAFDEQTREAFPPIVMIYPYILVENVCVEAPTRVDEVCFDLWQNMNTGHRFRCDGKPFIVSGVV